MKEELAMGAEAPLSPARAALLASVDALSVSEELKERWRMAAREDSRLRLPTFFVRCADMGYACLPTLIRRAFAEKNVSFEDLCFVYQTLGAQHADAQRMIFAPEELEGMELAELLAVTEYSLENFLDIYQFMPSMQAKKAGSNSFTIPYDRQELADYLEKAGFTVTQATVSRDIRELKLLKQTLLKQRLPL